MLQLGGGGTRKERPDRQESAGESAAGAAECPPRGPEEEAHQEVKGFY